MSYSGMRSRYVEEYYLYIPHVCVCVLVYVCISIFDNHDMRERGSCAWVSLSLSLCVCGSVGRSVGAYCLPIHPCNVWSGVDRPSAQS